MDEIVVSSPQLTIRDLQETTTATGLISRMYYHRLHDGRILNPQQKFTVSKSAPPTAEVLGNTVVCVATAQLETHLQGS
jgi:hypothetical protein